MWLEPIWQKSLCIATYTYLYHIAITISDMRQAGDGDEKGDQQDGEAVVDSFHLSDNSGREEKYVTCIDPTRLTSENSHQPWQESGKNDGIEERNSGKDGNVESWGEGNVRDKGKGRSESGERIVGSRVDGENMVDGEKMLGSENVRLKLALVECRLLLQDQVGMMMTTVTKMMVTVIKMLIMVTKMLTTMTIDKDAGHNDHNEVAAGEPVVPREGGGRCAAFHDHRTTRKVFIFCFHHNSD